MKRLVLIGLPVVAGLSCGSPVAPSQILGDWSGRDAPAHFAYIEIRFRQEGSRIVGTACEYDTTFLVFSDVPVTLVGDRRVSFVVDPQHYKVGDGTLPARSFSGQFESDGLLRGRWSSNSDQVVFQRGGSLCASAK